MIATVSVRIREAAKSPTNNVQGSLETTQPSRNSSSRPSSSVAENLAEHPQVKGVEACVMAGDPQQLPPTVKSDEAIRKGLGSTLFARMIDKGASCPAHCNV